MASMCLIELILHIGWRVVGKPRKQSGEKASLNYFRIARYPFTTHQRISGNPRSPTE